MKTIQFSLQDLVQIISDLNCEGHFDGSIKGIASLDKAQEQELSFLSNPKYKGEVQNTLASVVIVPNEYEGSPRQNQVYLRVPNPSLALALVCWEIEKLLWPQPQSGIHQTAFIHPDAKVDASAFIGPMAIIEAYAVVGKNAQVHAGAYVGEYAKVGAESVLMPQVKLLSYCEVWERVRLHAGAVIGADGYGYEFENGKHHKLPQIGKVVIENDVEIGANTTIDRARFGTTLIGEGTKIDNLVQVAHNVTIGKHCLLMSQSGIAGSTVLEDYVIICGQAGLKEHLKIGKGTIIGAQSGINCHLPPNSKVRGAPPYPYMLAQRIEVLKKRLPELFERVSNLECMLRNDTHSFLANSSN